MAKQTKRAIKFKKQGGLKAVMQKRKVKKQSAKKFNHDKDDDAKPKAAQVVEKTKSSYQEMNVDDFMDGGFLDVESDEEEEEEENLDDEDNESEEEMEVEDNEDDDEDDEDDDEDDEEEDEEEDDDDIKNLKATASGLKNESKKHQADLEKLKEQDPEFFKFLQENDASLLDFADQNSGSEDDEDDEDEEEDDDEDEDEEEEEEEDDDDDDDDEGKEDDDAPRKPKAKSTASSSVEVLTSEGLRALEQGLIKNGSTRALRKVVAAFRAGCHVGEEDEEGRAASGGMRYRILTSAVYNRLMVMALKRMDGAFRSQLGLSSAPESEAAAAAAATPAAELGSKEEEAAVAAAAAAGGGVERLSLTSCPRWSKLGPVVKTCLNSLLTLLQDVSERTLQSFVLRRLEHYVPFLLPFPQLARRYLKLLLRIWAAGGAAEGQEGDDPLLTCRLLAFLRVRQLALTMPFPFLEDCLKGAYLTLVRNSKWTSELSLPAQTMMRNCVVELAGVDPVSTYQHAFVYVRQLGIHLRSALAARNKDALQSVYNWQFLHSLKVWASVLCAYPKDEQLKALVYPLTQVVLGAVRLLPTTRYMPFRLHCVRLLQELSDATGVYIPCAPLLLEVLDCSELRRRPVGSTARPPLLHVLVKLPKGAIGTRAAQEAIVGETLLLLRAELELHRYHIALPELLLPTTRRLKMFAKTTKVSGWRSQTKSLLTACAKAGAMVATKRRRVDFAPKDTEKVAQFLAKENTKAKAHRRSEAAALELKEQRQRLEVAAAERGEKDKKKGKKKKEAEEEEEDEEDDEDDEEEDEDEDEDEGEDEDEEEEEEEKVRNSTKGGKKKSNKSKVPLQSAAEFAKALAQIDGDDEVEDVEFSSSDDEE